MSKPLKSVLSDLVRRSRRCPDETREALVEEFHDRLADFSGGGLSEAQRQEVERRLANPRYAEPEKVSEFFAQARHQGDMKVVFREEALADLDEIAQFIAQHDAKAADRVVARVYRTIHRTIATLPLSGRLNPANNTREYAVPGLPYLVVYFQRRRNRCGGRVPHGARSCEQAGTISGPRAIAHRRRRDAIS